MEQDSEPSVLGAGSYRSVSIDRLSQEEKKMILEALKITRITIIGDKTAESKSNNSLIAQHLKLVIEMFEGANEVWLTRNSTRSKSS